MLVVCWHVNCRWLSYYMDGIPLGPTVAEGEWFHAAPSSAFDFLHPEPHLHITTMPTKDRTRLQHVAVQLAVDLSCGNIKQAVAGGTGAAGSMCDVLLFSHYMQALQLAMPITAMPELEQSCGHLLGHMLSDNYQLRQQHAGQLPVPPLTWEYLHGLVLDSKGKQLPDSSPIAAVKHTQSSTEHTGDRAAGLWWAFHVLQSQHAAWEWLKQEDGKMVFPSLADGALGTVTHPGDYP